jgi:hypothetical protein
LAGKTQPCLQCGYDVPYPLLVCTRCDGAPLYGVPGGEWSVELGPVSSMMFRKQALDKLEPVLDGLNRTAADKAMGGGRVRLVEGLTRGAAEGLARSLGRKETSAAAAQGPTPKLGAGAALKGGLPLVLTGAGALLGFLIEPIGTTIGLLAGGGAGTFVGVFNSQKDMPVLARPKHIVTLPYQVQQAAEQLHTLRAKLPKAAGDQLAGVVEIGFRIIGRLTDQDDPVSYGADGLEDGMGKAAVVFVQDAVAAADKVVRDGVDQSTDALKTLEQLETTARAAQSELDAMEQKAEAAMRGA